MNEAEARKLFTISDERHDDALIAANTAYREAIEQAHREYDHRNELITLALQTSGESERHN